MDSPRRYIREHMWGAVQALLFFPTRWRYRRLLTPAEPTHTVEEYLHELRRDGVTIIPELLPADVVEQMRAALPRLDEFVVSPEGDRSLTYPDAHEIEALRPFFDNETIRDLVRSYLSRDAVMRRRTIGIKVVTGEFPTFETNYHMDTWKHRVKVFFYLEDVTADTAPTIYLRGSHRGFWRLWTEQRIHRYFRVQDTGFAAGGEDFFYLGSFWPHEVRQLKNDYGFEDFVCTAPAGSALVFDGRGLHRATPLRAGRRAILVSYWIHPGHHT